MATVVLLSHRAARLPGLAEHVASNAARVISLDRMDLFRGIATHQALIRSDPSALRLVTRLPVQTCPGFEREAPPPPTALRLPAGAPHTRSVRQRRGGDRAEPDVRPRGISRSCRSISRATRCRSSPDSSGVQLRLADGTAALLDGDVAQNGIHHRQRRGARSGRRAISTHPHAVRAVKRRAPDQRLLDVVPRRHVVRIRRDRAAVHHDDSRHRPGREEGQAGRSCRKSASSISK